MDAWNWTYVAMKKKLSCSNEHLWNLMWLTLEINDTNSWMEQSKLIHQTQLRLYRVVKNKQYEEQLWFLTTNQTEPNPVFYLWRYVCLSSDNMKFPIIKRIPHSYLTNPYITFWHRVYMIKPYEQC